MSRAGQPLAGLALLLLLAVPVSAASNITVYAVYDGYIANTSTQTWTAMRDSSVGAVTASNSQASDALLTATTSSGQYNAFRRGFYTFPVNLTGKIITSATLYIFVYGKGDGLGAVGYGLTGFHPADKRSVAAADMVNFDDFRLSSDTAYADITAAAYNTWTITNLSYLNQTDDVIIGVRSVPDIDHNDSGYTWSSGATSNYNVYYIEYTGTTRDPKLYVEYTDPPAGDPPVAAFSASRTTAGYGAPITFTDASTLNPTGWYWEFGDGNTSASQNPIHVYDVQGTFSVNLKATNATGSDWENKSSYITIGTRPDSYLNPYTKMIPWLDQGDQGWCSGAAASYAAMLLRYDNLSTTPSATQEPFTRDVNVTVGGVEYSSDEHVNYTPSVASIYWPFDEAPGTHFNYTALGEVMKTGYNLQTDQITSKYNDTEVYYPKTEAYLDANRYNPIKSYTTQTGITDATWESLKQNISDNHVVLILIDTYSNYDDNSTHVTLDNGQVATMFQNPTGSETDGHWMAAVGYNNTLDQIYTIQSWGENRFSKDWTKMSGITKTYWTYDDGDTRQAFVVPKTLIVTEVLPGDTTPPASLSGFANTTNCSQTNITWTNPGDSDFSHTYALWNNIAISNFTNSTTFYLNSSLAASTTYTLSTRTVDLSGNMNETWYNYSVTTTTCADTTPPGSITGLTNTSVTCSQLFFNWTNPADADYGGLMVLQNNTALTNLSNSTTGVSWTGLPESTAITFSSKTFDLTGNVNSSFVNMTKTTDACGAAPVAAFSANDTAVCTLEAVKFTDSSTNTPTSWNWTFGDGNVSAEQHPVKTWNMTGTFTINLTASNDYGADSEVKSNYITVTECAAPPTPTPTPTPSGACSYVNVTGATILNNFTNLSMSAGSSTWGVTVYNTTEGNVSWWQCGDAEVSTGGGSGGGGEATGILFGVVGGFLGVIIFARRNGGTP